MKKYICIHGHFYQPPRDNPWLQAIELQDSAWPYHDWNERITAECYAPNTASRIQDDQQRILNIINNYSRISFNFGPTLLSWLEKRSADVYQAILEADRLSQKRFNGHGAALAQVFSHMILPLANTRDKQTQVIWGIRDFEHRFRRKPEGMWLAETAVDLATLEVLAEHGIKFTVLAPGQASRVKKINGRNWRDVSGQRIDPKQPYLCNLPSGKSIVLFFYDGPISRDVAFGDVLKSGERFAHRLTEAFVHKQDEAQLVHIATDGETYGHHHAHGDMALAYCLYHLEKNKLAEVTIYPDFLEKYPPTHEVEIFENSSWSCAHGVGRWKEDCGCSSGSRPGWHQQWRKPLRQAMDWLRDKLIELYDKEAPQLLRDPWAARNDYIRVILDRSEENVQKFINEHQTRQLDQQEQVRARKLLEMQLHAMLMYTSCGWFFDDVSGIETVQIMLYAARALQLARETADWDLEPEYLDLLAKAPSNVPEYGNAARVYEQLARPSMLDFLRVGAHYAIASLFAERTEDIQLFAYTAQSELFKRQVSGRQRLAAGRARLRSSITGEEALVCFAMKHYGDQAVVGGVKFHQEQEDCEAFVQELKQAFTRGDRGATVALIDKFFGRHSYSFWHLFKDEQRRIIDLIAAPARSELELNMRKVFEENRLIMETMNGLKVVLPRAFYATAKFVFNNDLRKVLLEEKDLDLDRLKKLVWEVERWPVKLDKKTLGFAASRRVEGMMEQLKAAPTDPGLMQKVAEAVSMFNQPPLKLPLDLWRAQNIYFDLCRAGDERTGDSDRLFAEIGVQLRVKTG
ncbi:MAG: DUF3536 domain-containing protein [Candidatus Saganbacteria bacterium]|nr:DUF3536 domain-containing protein [Candidatus Saganbacteria bacterium]